MGGRLGCLELRCFRARRKPRLAAAPRFCPVLLQHPLLVLLRFEPRRGGERVRQPCRVFAFAASAEQKRGAAGWGPKSVQHSGWDGLCRLRRRPPDQIEQLTERSATLSGTGYFLFCFFCFSPSCESSTSVSDVGLSPSHF